MKCYKCRKDVSDEAFICPQCQTQLLPTEELINQAISNEQTAIEKLYNMAYSSVYYTVHAMIKDPDLVLDIVQDSFIKGFKNLSQLKEPVKYRAWMKRIAHNHAIDYLRKVKPTVFSSMLSTDSEEMLDFKDERTENLPDAVADQKETARLMNEILQTLSEDQRLVVGMYYYEQMSIKEIAKELNCSENTIKSRLSYGRKKIELQVKELEKRGTKLYGLAPIPFLLWLFKTADVQAAPNLSKEFFQILNASASSDFANMTSGTSNVKTKTSTIKTDSCIAQNISAKSISAKIIAGITAVSILGGGLIIGPKLIKPQNNRDTHTHTSTPIPNEKKETYPWEEYVNDTLIPVFGKVEEGTYQFDTYTEYEQYQSWLSELQGLLNYSIMDFDNDGEKELLAIFLEQYVDDEKKTLRNHILLQMYEQQNGSIEIAAEYRTTNDLVGVGDKSNSGIFLKQNLTETYICIGVYNQQYRNMYQESEAHILTYNGDFQEHIPSPQSSFLVDATLCNENLEPYSEAEIVELKKGLEQTAKEFTNMDFKNSALKIKDSSMVQLDFNDSTEEMLVHVDGLDQRNYVLYSPDNLELPNDISPEDMGYYVTTFTFSEDTYSGNNSPNTDFISYIEETLIPDNGKISSGTYEYGYQQQNDNTITIEKISDQYGILNYKILDFDNDGEDELLVISLEEYTDTSGWTEELCNRLVLQIYENKSGNVKKTGEYKMKANVLGGADKELSGVALKEWNGTLYICASVCNSLYTFSNGIKTEVCVLSYDGSMFHEYISMDKPDTGSEFEHAEPLANEMASKAEAIGLTQSAAKMKETFIRCLDFSDIDDNNIMVFIQGENDGTYLQNFGWGTGGLTADKLGKVIVNLYFSPQ